ncbi:peptidoglycan-binding protein [Streptomyces sp. NPDC090025]|uniref:peptidoglycan-binding protein n=1 Tax=Streptomyces sp. NPDC090025 TaxID=3365922 RepID=UPI0038359BFC
MTVPTFTEMSPETDCACPGCARHRNAYRRQGWRYAAPAHRRAAALVTLGGVSLTGIAAEQATAATGQEQAGSVAAAPATAASVVHDQTAGRTSASAISRSEILRRAQGWVDQRVPYSMNSTWRDGYRQDCSGFVSMAWRLDGSEWTGSLAAQGVRISKDELRPGDILLFHNASNPGAGSHVVLFAGWANANGTAYVAYEQTRPRTVKRTNPYAYYSHSGAYVPYRYRNVVEDGATEPGGSGSAAFPGAGSFGPGRHGAHITRLGERLVAKGYGRYYREGPGPGWSGADRRNVEAFQRAQGWTGADADGYPGPETWRRLFS